MDGWMKLYDTYKSLEKCIDILSRLLLTICSLCTSSLRIQKAKSLTKTIKFPPSNATTKPRRNAVVLGPTICSRSPQDAAPQASALQARHVS